MCIYIYMYIHNVCMCYNMYIYIYIYICRRTWPATSGRTSTTTASWSFLWQIKCVLLLVILCTVQRICGDLQRLPSFIVKWATIIAEICGNIRPYVYDDGQLARPPETSLCNSLCHVMCLYINGLSFQLARPGHRKVLRRILDICRDCHLSL